MIARIIDWCAHNRFLVFTATVVLTLWGVWAMTATPLDAVPDISDVQVTNPLDKPTNFYLMYHNASGIWHVTDLFDVEGHETSGCSRTPPCRAGR